MSDEAVKLIFLGSGSAFTVGEDNFHSNILLTTPKNNFLIDCGSDARFSLHEQGFCFNDIQGVYISHLHADHAGGLEWLGFNRKFNSKLPKPALYINKRLVKLLWEKVLSGGMSSIQDEKNTLETYFDVKTIDKNGKFTWNKIPFQMIKTIHVVNNNKLRPSYGLFFQCGSKKILITTDTQFRPDIFEKYYHDADLIFHDCETSGASGVHSHYTQLKTLPLEIRQKMWLYHYNPGELPDAKADEFLGFVKKGQVFYIKD